jgi:phospholipase/lecithinase/hemolysin
LLQMTNIYNNPSAYLNGTAPLNVAVPVRDCTPEVCITNESPDSHMWWDDLHPSEQTQRVIAREFVSVIEGKSQYASYWG